MTRLMTLPELYEKYIRDFKETGVKPKPGLLLALLLLKDKDKFKGKNYELVSFYNQNRKEIDLRIEQIMSDFSITIEDLRKENIFIGLGTSRDDEKVKLDQFQNGIIMLMMVANCSQVCNPEEMYNKYCTAFGWECLPQVSKVIPYSNLSPLQRKYRQYLNRYKRDGKRPDISKLLLLLMLSEKDKYPSDSANEHALYSRHKEKIEESARQIIRDFELDKQTINEKVMDADGNIDIHKFIVEYGFNIVLLIIAFENCYNPSRKPEEIYDFWVGYINGHLKKGTPFSTSNILCINGEELSEEQYRQLDLETKYEYHKAVWYKKRIHPHPSELLAILLLINKDEFELDECNDTEKFSNKFWNDINKYINEVMTTFEMDEHDLDDLVLGMGFDYELLDLNYDRKIYLVFKPGIETLMRSLENKHIPAEVMHNCLRQRYKVNRKKTKLVNKSNCRRRVKKPHYSTTTTGFKG